MKIIAMIPARYAASRFPGKLMQDLQGKPVIQRTYEAAVNTGLFQEVYVVTDSTTIYDTIANIGGKAIMSIKQHECGSDRNDPNTVKVIVDNQHFALYFSRAPIPYPRSRELDIPYFKHKGIYAFRKSALMDFQRLPMLILEATEKIEAIRYLEYGKKIKMVETSVTGIEIDTPEDLEKAKKVWR